MKGFLVLVGAAGFASAAFATGTPAYGAFNPATSLTGVTTNVSNGGLTYALLLGSNPQLVFNGDTYSIQNIFGVYALSSTGALNGAGPGYTGWSFDAKDAGGTGVAGWTGPTANDGLYANGSQTFTFTSLNTAGVTDIGYHIRINGTFSAQSGLTGNTAYFKVTPAPEPASMAALGLGALALIRRRRNRA